MFSTYNGSFSGRRTTVVQATTVPQIINNLVYPTHRQVMRGMGLIMFSTNNSSFFGKEEDGCSSNKVPRNVIRGTHIPLWKRTSTGSERSSKLRTRNVYWNSPSSYQNQVYDVRGFHEIIKRSKKNDFYLRNKTFYMVVIQQYHVH